MQASVCISTFNKPMLLRRSLESICKQSVPFSMEIIVVDDGSEGNETAVVCADFPTVTFQRIERPAIHRNPSVARNVAYRMATGKVIIAQSDDVVHTTPNTIERLVGDLQPGNFLIARVLNSLEYITKEVITIHNLPDLWEMTGPNNKRPFFFLGSLWRKDLYAVGGNSEDFVAPGYDDNFFADCLMRGLKLEPFYTDRIVAMHLDHERPSDLCHTTKASIALYEAKQRECTWKAVGVPWPYEESS